MSVVIVIEGEKFRVDRERVRKIKKELEKRRQRDKFGGKRENKSHSRNKSLSS